MKVLAFQIVHVSENSRILEEANFEIYNSIGYFWNWILLIQIHDNCSSPHYCITCTILCPEIVLPLNFFLFMMSSIYGVKFFYDTMYSWTIELISKKLYKDSP